MILIGMYDSSYTRRVAIAMALYGIAPASLLQYLICRHYLRRRPCFAEGDTR